MAKKFDLDSYRRNLRRKKIMNKVLFVFFILIVIVAIFYFIRTIYVSGQIASEIPAEYPVSLKNEVPNQINTTASNIVVTSSVEILFFAENSVEEKSYLHNYANPVSKVGGNRVLTYDQGGYALRVDTKSGNMFELKSENTVLFAQINEAGYIAVVTIDDRYTSRVAVYNNAYEEIYNYYTNEHVMSLELISNNECVLIGQKADMGEMDTILYGLDFGSETEVMQKEVNDFYGLGVFAKSNGNIVLVGKDGLMVTTKTGEVQSEFNFNSTLVNIMGAHEKFTIICAQDVKNPNNTDVYLFDELGMLVKQITVDGVVEDAYISDEKIYILTQKSLGIYDDELLLEESVNNSAGLMEVLLFKDGVYAISREFLYKISE